MFWVRALVLFGQRLEHSIFVVVERFTPSSVLCCATAGEGLVTDQNDFPLAAIADARLSAIVDSSFDAIVSKDLNGIIRTWNAAAEELFGYSAEEAIGKPVLMIIPPNRYDEEAEIIERISRGERVETFQTVRVRKDGSLVPVSLTISPIKNTEGKIVGASKIARDISAAQENEQRIRMLLREVNHRVKNQYAVILSIINETSRRTGSPQEFAQKVRQRVMALASSHDLLVAADWHGASVADLLMAQLNVVSHEDLVSISGPLVTVVPAAVQHLGIALHELTTNSVKYGVLGAARGHIDVRWGVEEIEPYGQSFVLRWEERSESGATASASEQLSGGFGTIVLTRLSSEIFGGTATFQTTESGVVWSLVAPVASVLASPAYGASSPRLQSGT